MFAMCLQVPVSVPARPGRLQSCRQLLGQAMPRQSTQSGTWHAGSYERVPQKVLSRAAYAARHALAAYGLQSARLWNKAQEPSWQLKVGSVEWHIVRHLNELCNLPGIQLPCLMLLDPCRWWADMGCNHIPAMACTIHYSASCTSILAAAMPAMA